MIPVPPIRFDLALARRLAMCSLRAYDPSGLPSGIRWGERTREPSTDAVPSPTDCQAHPPASSLSPQRGEGPRVRGENSLGTPSPLLSAKPNEAPQLTWSGDFKLPGTDETVATHEPGNDYYLGCVACGAELDRTMPIEEHRHPRTRPNGRNLRHGIARA